MGEVEKIPESKIVDHLILLVGGNPLPNAVAGKLLVKDGGRITLLHSKGESGTGQIAGQLADWLYGQGIHNLALDEMDEVDRHDIYKVVKRTVGDSSESVGLHYTGGTKAMAVHAHAAVLAKRPDVVFSYLNARTLCLVFDDGLRRYVGWHPDFNLTFEQLFKLHGWQLEKSDTPHNTAPPDMSDYTQFLGRGNQFEEAIAQSALSLTSEHTLSDLRLNIFARQKDVLLEFDVGFLRGYQLFVLSCAVTNPLPMKDGQLNERARNRNRAKVKGKLLEAFVRAKQLGGDEASVALMCFFDDPKLEQELQQTLQVKGRVKVFGRSHLPDLSQHLSYWIRQQSRQGKEC